MTAKVKLARINGTAIVLPGDARWSLIEYLRERLRLNGLPRVCEHHGCGGACTVLVDGVVVRGCQLPLAAIAGRAVTTLEGVAEQRGLTPLQLAFIDDDALRELPLPVDHWI